MRVYAARLPSLPRVHSARLRLAQPSLRVLSSRLGPVLAIADGATLKKGKTPLFLRRILGQGEITLRQLHT